MSGPELTGDARVVEWAIRQHVLQHGRPMHPEELDAAAPLTPMNNGKARREHTDRQLAALSTLMFLGLVMIEHDGWHHRGLEREMLATVDSAGVVH